MNESRSHPSLAPLDLQALDKQKAGAEAVKESKQPSDMEYMKERFAKLLLGEDMSGGGKGVSSALALSNAITNLAASVFGEQKRLEPMNPERKARWKKEIDWLLSVTDQIVEFVPSKQKQKDGSNMEIMITKQRTDLQMNIPALRKLDAMLIDCLENFKGDENEFYYVSKDEEAKAGNQRDDDKWWIPTPKVPPNGLSDSAKKWLQFQKDCVHQVQKAAMAINAQVLSEMEIPESYIESLPKNGRVSLGEPMYRSITDDHFDPDHFLSMVDLSSDLKIVDLKNRIEASVVIWRKKKNAKDGKSAWSSAVSSEKRELFEDRAETILLILKQRYPGTSQSQLDISKIQYNRDVGQAILESYSRTIETMAYTVMSRIEDVLHADAVASSSAEQKNPPKKSSSPTESEDVNSPKTPAAMTLLDFMGWNEAAEAETKQEPKEEKVKEAETTKFSKKVANIVTNKRMSYLENLAGSRSPTARH